MPRWADTEPDWNDEDDVDLDVEDDEVLVHRILHRKEAYD